MKRILTAILMAIVLTPAMTFSKPLESVIKKTDMRVFSYVATYNRADFLKDPDVAKALIAIMPKAQINGLAAKMRVGPPMDYVRGYVVASGCDKTQCANKEAQVWYNLGNKSAIVMIKNGGVYTIYTTTTDWWMLPQALKAKIMDSPYFDKMPANVKLIKPKPAAPAK